jgi:LuxR family transcriptional regulator, maltose regulon positive regulatory protein
MERLNESRRRALTTIVAPAGFGKTTVAATWAQRRPYPVAWLSLQAADRPRDRFLPYLIQALQAVAPHIGQTSLALLRGASPDGALFALVNDLADVESDFALVLDDYHSADTPANGEIVQFLLDNRPPTFHLVIATRVAPNLNLTRLRARDQVIEISATDLRFTKAETGAFVESSMGLRLATEELARLSHTTEGWPVALHLYALACRRGERQEILGQEHIFDYLAEEVLRHETPEVQEFLKRSALFDRLCAPLCASVLYPGLEPEQAEQRCRRLLAYVDNANLFLVALDATGVWYRYHALFADFLRSQLAETEALPLYRAASDWFEQNGWFDDAIHYAAHAADHERAATLLEHHYIDMLQRGEQSTLMERMAAMPPEVWQQRPRLWLAQGWLNVTSFDTAAADNCIAKAEALIPAGARGDRLRGEANSLSVLSSIFSGKVVATDEIAAIAATLPEDDDFLHVMLQINLGASHVMNGETDQAIAAFTAAVGATEASNTPLMTLFAYMGLGEAYQMRGSFAPAELTFRQAVDYAKKTLGEHSFLLGVPYISYADLLREQDRFAEATHYAEVGIAYTQVWQPVASLDGQIALARILAAQGKWEESFRRLEQAMEVAKNSITLLDDTFLALHLSRLRLMHGDPARAVHLIRLFDLEKNLTQMCYHLWEPAQLLLYRAEIVAFAGDRAAAQAVVDGLMELIAKAERRERVTHLIEALVLLAYAQEQAGQRGTVAETLSRALTLGAQSGYVRLFADEGKRFLHLLEKHRAQIEAPSIYLEHLLQLLRRESVRRVSSQKVTLEGLTSLTRRELDILSLLATGKSNHEIAAERVLAPNTVKKHVANILSKLGVANRTQAVMLARKLGWLA